MQSGGIKTNVILRDASPYHCWSYYISCDKIDKLYFTGAWCNLAQLGPPYYPWFTIYKNPTIYGQDGTKVGDYTWNDWSTSWSGSSNKYTPENPMILDVSDCSLIGINCGSTGEQSIMLEIQTYEP